jgi:hypothetical protein
LKLITLTEPYLTHIMCTTPPVGPGESNFRPGGSVARRRSVSAARASQVVPATPPCRLSLRGEQLDVAHALPPSSRQSTGCATHLAHVNVCGLSLSPALPSMLLPSAALPSIASAPSLHTYIFPSVSVSCSTQRVAGVAAGDRGAHHRNARLLRPMQPMQRRARTCALRAARTCALSPAALPSELMA